MLRAATAGHSLPHPTHGPGPGLSIAEHKTHQAKSPRFQGIDILRFQAPLTPVNNDTFTASRQGKRAGRTTFDRRDPFSEEKPTIVGRSPVCVRRGIHEMAPANSMRKTLYCRTRSTPMLSRSGPLKRVGSTAWQRRKNKRANHAMANGVRAVEFALGLGLRPTDSMNPFSV